MSSDQQPEARARPLSDAEQALARDLGAWRTDRVLGPVVLGMAVALAVLGAVAPARWDNPWWWLLAAPAVFALLKAAGAVWSLWRRRAWRDTDLDRVAASKTDQIRQDLAAGAVDVRDRALAARLLLNEGAFFRSQGWVATGLGAGQLDLAGSGGLDAVRVVIGIVALVGAMAVFWYLRRNYRRAIALLINPTGPTSTL